MKLWLEKIHLDLKVNWKLSRNQTTFKENYIVHLETSLGHFRSEIAPNIRYGETPEGILTQFNEWSQAPMNLENLDRMPLFHSLRFGLESVLFSYEAKKKNQTLTQFLGLLPMKRVPTSFSMPITAVGEIKDYLAPLGRFKFLKIKVDAETGVDMLQEIRKHTNAALRVDANEGWKSLDDFLKFEETLKGMNIELIEQPFPSTMREEYKELKKKTAYTLLADESIEDVGDFSELSKQFHAVNLKLMKTGSLIKTKSLLAEARAHNMTAMIGCMIETTIGISYGMLFSGMVDYVDLDGFLLVKNEPFNLMTEKEGLVEINS